MTALVEEQGLLRVRLDEAQWRSAYDAAGAPAGLGGLGPQVTRGADEVPDPATVAAVRDLFGAPVRVEVVTSHRGTGVVGGFAVRPGAVVSLTRVVGGVDDRMGAVPGVELSVFTADVLVEELLRLLPEARDAWRSTEPLVLPAEDALTLVRAVKQGDERLLRTTLEVLGLPEVPPLIPHLVQPLGDASVVLTRTEGGTRHLRLLLTERGWLRLSLAPDTGLTHTPTTTREVAVALTTSLATALRPPDPDGREDRS